MSNSLSETDHPDALAFINNPAPEALQAVLAEGNIAALSPPQRLQFLAAICRSTGLNPLTAPFEFISLNGKLRIYAKKDCTEQLRKIHNVSVEILEREWVQDLYVVKCRASLPTGRQDESIGALSIKGKAGEELANALMKAETKAKRRVTLAICGLGFMDESEVESAQHQAQARGEVGTVSDPFQETVIEMEAERWQDCAWTTAIHGAAKLGDIAGMPDGDKAMGKLWAADRNNPALCAWAFSWITNTMRNLDMEWSEVQEAFESMPEAPEELTPTGLWEVAKFLRAEKFKHEKANQ